jgi:hypothetical protein
MEAVIGGGGGTIITTITTTIITMSIPSERQPSATIAV